MPFTEKTFSTQEIFVAQKIRTTNSATDKLGAYWMNFITTHGAQISPTTKIFALYFNYDQDFAQDLFNKEYDFCMGLSNPTTTNDLTSFTIPRNNYAVFTGKGEMPQTVVTTWQEVWSTFPQLQSCERIFGIDLQIHDPRKQDEVEIWVTIK